MAQRFERKHACLVAAIAAAFPLAVQADAAGRIDFAVGNVLASGTDGARRSLAKGGEVFPGDTILTNDGRLQLRMTDGAMVSLLPGSEYRIDAYQFSGKADGSERGIFSLLKGGLRTITGLIGRVDRSRYRIDTKVATIGIRGTEFSVAYGNSINVNTGEGVVEVCNAQGCLLLYPGDEGYVPSGDGSPQLVQTGEEKPGKDMLDPLTQGFEAPAEQRNADGSSIVLAGTPLLTGTQTYATVYANADTAGCCLGSFADKGVGTGTINGSGELTAFEAFYGPTDPNTSGGNTVASLGNDGVVAWGKWIDNGAGFNGSLSGGEGGVLHYVTGIPTPDSQSALSAMYGTSATFSLLGGGVTGTSSGAGSITSASMNVNFSAATVTSLSVGMTLSGGSFTLSASSMPITGFGVAPVFSGSGGSVTGTGCSTTCSSADIVGAFFGNGASRAGVSFKFNDNLYYGQNIAGAVALKNNAAP